MVVKSSPRPIPSPIPRFRHYWGGVLHNPKSVLRAHTSSPILPIPNAVYCCESSRIFNCQNPLFRFMYENIITMLWPSCSLRSLLTFLRNWWGLGMVTPLFSFSWDCPYTCTRPWVLFKWGADAALMLYSTVTIESRAKGLQLSLFLQPLAPLIGSSPIESCTALIFLSNCYERSRSTYLFSNFCSISARIVTIPLWGLIRNVIRTHFFFKL